MPLQLKRGLERTSCDFCFRRKVKCDRVPRLDRGYTECSQCDLRQTSCTFRTDDVRTQRRCRRKSLSLFGCGGLSRAAAAAATTVITGGGGGREDSESAETETTPAGTDVCAMSMSNGVVEAGNEMDPGFDLDHTKVTRPDDVSTQALNGYDYNYHTYTSMSIIESSQQQQQQPTLFFPNDIEFDLSPGGVSYLDSIFLGNCSQETMLLSPLEEAVSDGTEVGVDDYGGMVPAGTVFSPSAGEELAANSGSGSGSGVDDDDDNPYRVPGIGADTMNAAIEAYFAFASLALPVLYQDAFMDDYKSRRCSPALVFAVACRGCPFIQEEDQQRQRQNQDDKWAIQQCLASHFRDAFLLSRVSATETRTAGDAMRLDDLEALALMVGFEYETPDSSSSHSSHHHPSPIQSQLQNLFLTHDFLVMMTLQYRSFSSSRSSSGCVNLARSSQRQTLLFWYVYGWDAFISLDRNLTSRIRDEDVDGDFDDSEKPRKFAAYHESHGGYFDAILALATIARRMTRELCGSAARRKGVCPRAVQGIYKQLEAWASDLPDLPVDGDYNSADAWESTADSVRGTTSSQQRSHSSSSSSDSNTTSRNLRTTAYSTLHQVFLTFLKLNLYMQLDVRVSEHGLRDRGSFLGQMVEARVRYETLQAAFKTVQVAQWARGFSSNEAENSERVRHRRRREEERENNIFDLAPELLRDVCVGTARWLSQRAGEIAVCGEKENDKAVDSSREKRKQQQAGSLMESAIILRDVAATAISHRDTRPMIDRLDEEMGPLNYLVRK